MGIQVGQGSNPGEGFRRKKPELTVDAWEVLGHVQHEREGVPAATALFPISLLPPESQKWDWEPQTTKRQKSSF